MLIPMVNIRRRGGPMLIGVFSLFWAVAGAASGTVSIRDGGAGFALNVTSLKEMRFQGVTRQKHDFSCGSAALSTLLTYHYLDPVDEMTIFKEMYQRGTREKIRIEGFSLLDMKKYLENNGYRADGYRVPLDRLIRAGIPAIVIINEKGYQHFVVIKGADRSHVLIGDPAKGLRVMARLEFTQVWNQTLFIIRNKKAVGQKHFNLDREWRRVALAPLDDVRPLDSSAAFTLRLPFAGDF